MYEKNGKYYDEDEHFEIDEEKAREIDGLEYKGIYVSYQYDTNTIIFSRYNEDYDFSDDDDLDTMIYRNYSEEDLREIIDNRIDEWKELTERRKGE